MQEMNPILKIGLKYLRTAFELSGLGLLAIGLWTGALGADGTVLIPEDREHGKWHTGTRTYTLSGDVVSEVQVVEDSLIFDGAGYRVRAPERGSGHGILLQGRRGVVVRNTEVGDFARQILLLGCSGNTIVDNLIGGASFEHDHGRGIYLQESHGNLFVRNTIANHGGGVSLESSSANVFHDNVVSQSRKVALRIFGQSEGNRFLRNSFVENRRQIEISRYSIGNIFNDVRPVGGNFWDHCIQPDVDGDHFVDTTYAFAGGQDALPWISPASWPRETQAAVGLNGVVRVAPGGEVVLLSVGVTGDGYERLHSMTLGIADLTLPTGLRGQEFQELRLYRSRDPTLNSIDFRLGTLHGSAIQIGGLSTIQVGRIERPPARQQVFYLVTAILAEQVTDGHAFRVGFASGGVRMDGLGLGTEIPPNDLNRTVIEVQATRLVFTVQPSGADSDGPLSIQPVVTAMDELGNVDRDFTEIITLSLADRSSLSLSLVAQAGVAPFVGVTYRGHPNEGRFRLVADDEADRGTDLSPVVSSMVRVWH